MTRSTQLRRAGGCFAVLLASGCASKTTAPETTPEEPTPTTGDQPMDTPVTASSCAAVQCETNTYCDDVSGQAKCLPLPSCVDHQCPEGQSCELVQVQCIRAPCPPQPSCVPSKT
jgi:hypothetical protein